MDASQRSRALRLVYELETGRTSNTTEVAYLLRELAAEPVRVPLTDEQGIALANAVSSPNDATWIRDPDQCVLRIVRATEVAHGITGDAK